MPTIVKGSDYFQVITYTGNGGTNAITGLSFQPDFVWIKGRSGATDHALYDAVRGSTKDLVSNSTAAETTQSTGLVSFDSNGFTLGALSKVNTNGATYVAWCWKAGSSTVTNTNGTISSQVRANPTAGFSIVTYTSSATTGATVGHGLGIAPKVWITKRRGLTSDWYFNTSAVDGSNDYLLLNGTAAKTDNSSTALPTSTVFTQSSLGASETWVAYCFAEIAGFSKFGSYTGNGSADGVFNYLGFRPAFLLIKGTSLVSDWVILDVARNTYNVVGNILKPSSSQQETTAAGFIIDFVSNGFKIRGTDAGCNQSGSSYIFMAFAEAPFNYSNAR